MSVLSKALNEKSFDVRMIERGLPKGQILKQDVDKYLSKLSDDSQNALYVNTDSYLDEIKKQPSLRSLIHN